MSDATQRFGGWQSIKIEPIRAGARLALPDSQTPYQLLVGDRALVPSRLDHEGFEDNFALAFRDTLSGLRYFDDDGKLVGREQRDAALSTCAKLVTNFLKRAKLCTTDTPLQLDLVLNFSELAALPFETLQLRLADGTVVPIGDGRAGPIVITRRIRRGEIEESQPWPLRPRVLFVWAAPGKEVPSAEHRDALRECFGSFMPSRTFDGSSAIIPASEKVVTTIENADLAAIRKAVMEADREKQPYTHIHILAHGVAIDRPHGSKVFGVQLAGPDDGGGIKNTLARELADVLAPMRSSCRAVTLAICDGGNETSLLHPGESLAHSLHEEGFPIVAGSQLPLTFPGSEKLVRAFYRGEALGQDVRQTLYEARKSLHLDHADTHDWAALTAYVRLPEDYQQKLMFAATGADLVGMEAARAWLDDLLANGIDQLERYQEVIERIGAHGAKLEQRLATLDNDSGFVQRQALRNEIIGLVGSAFKRRAEAHWELSGRFPDQREQLIRQSLEELSQAFDWYKKGSEDLNNHWGLMQALCLEIVTTGSLSKRYYLDICRDAAGKEAEKSDFWAYGTLLEADLIDAFFNGQDRTDDVEAHFHKMIELAGDDNDLPRQSTVKQLKRYRDWWTVENDFWGEAGSDLSEAARKVLDRVDA